MSALPAESDICADCGLCCDGTLYARAGAQPDELDRMAAHGLTLEDGGRGFHFPCPALAGTRCSIYTERFHVCRSFHCKLATAYLNGEVERAQAVHHIAAAKTLRAAAAMAAPGLQHAEARQQAALAHVGWRDIPDPTERRRAAEAYLRLMALEEHLTRHFRKVAPALRLTAVAAGAGTPPEND